MMTDAVQIALIANVSTLIVAVLAWLQGIRNGRKTASGLQKIDEGRAIIDATAERVDGAASKQAAKIEQMEQRIVTLLDVVQDLRTTAEKLAAVAAARLKAKDSSG